MNHSETSPVIARATEKVLLIREIYRRFRRLTHTYSISRVDTSVPGEIRGVGGYKEGGYGEPLPEGTSPEIELALLTINECDSALYLFGEVLKDALKHDTKSITWWLFEPRPLKRIWISRENEAEPMEVMAHSHFQVEIDGVVLAGDFTGEQFGRSCTLARVEDYYRDFKDPEDTPEQLNAEEEMSEEDRDPRLSIFAEAIRSGIANYRMKSGHSIDGIVNMEGTKREEAEEKLHKMVRESVVEARQLIMDAERSGAEHQH